MSYGKERKLPDVDVKSIYSDLDGDERDYIIAYHGSLSKALRKMVKGGKYEKSVEDVEKLRSTLRSLGLQLYNSSLDGVKDDKMKVL